MSSQPQLDDGPDTALARILLREGLLSVGVLQAALAEVRRDRERQPGASLAGALLSAGSLSGAQLERACALLEADDQTVAASSRGALPTADATYGPYRVVREVARGGMGAVYEVEHQATGARFALKTILPAAPGEGLEEERIRFQREAEGMARLDHPHVARIFTADLFARSPYLVQELLTGGTLRERVLKGTLSDDEVARITIALAEGLAHSHAAGVLHRDLKPENVLFSAEGVPKLVDFGLAYALGGGAQSLTKTGSLLGTPAYMAPEQALGSRDFDQRVDVYGLGAVLYFVLCGHAPFAGSLFEVLEQVIHAAPRPPSARRPGRSPALEAICLKALAKSPADRYPTMEAFAEALREAQADLAAGPPRLGVALLAGLGLVVALVCAVCAALFLTERSALPAAPSPPPREAPTPSAAPSLVPSAEPTPSPGPSLPALLGARVHSWGPGPGALTGIGIGVAVVRRQVVTLETDHAAGAPHTPRGNEAQRVADVNRVRVWDLEEGRELRRLDLGPFSPLVLGVSPDGTRLALVGESELVILETARWEEVQRLKRALPGAARRAVFSPSGRQLAVGGDPGLEVWILPTAQLRAKLARVRDCFALRGEDALLYVSPPPPGGKKRGLVLWDLDREAEVYRRELDVSPVDIQVSPDGEQFLLGAWVGHGQGARETGEISLWDADHGLVLKQQETKHPLNRVAANPAWDQALALSGLEGQYRVGLPDLKVLDSGPSRSHHSSDGVLLADGRALVVGCDRRLRLLKSDLSPAWPARADEGPLRGLFFGPLRPVIGTSSSLRELPEAGDPQAPSRAWVNPLPGSLHQFAVSQDAARFWAASGRIVTGVDIVLQGRVGASVRCSDVVAGLAADRDGLHVLAALTPPGERLLYGRVMSGTIQWTPLSDPSASGSASAPTRLHIEGRSGFSGDEGGTLRAWDLQRKVLESSSGDPERPRPPAAIVALCFALEHLCAGTSDGRIRRWRPGWAEVPSLRGHSGPVLALCELPGGRLASAGRDGALVIWDTERRRVLERIDFAPDGDAPCLLASEGNRLLVGTVRGGVYEYRVAD